MRPAAYLWTIVIEGGKQKRLTLTKVNPWGERGVHYSETAKVKCEPLYRAAPTVSDGAKP